MAADAPDDQPLPWYCIGENSYFLFGNIATTDERNRGWNANAGFIVTPEGVVVIDVIGSPRLGRRLIATIKTVTDRPIRYVIITHNHPDHAYGAAAFQGLEGVTVITHAGSLDYTHSGGLERSVAYRSELLGDDMAGFKPVSATSTSTFPVSAATGCHWATGSSKSTTPAHIIPMATCSCIR